MRFDLFQYSPAWYKLMISVFVIFSCLFLTFLFSLVLAIPLFHLSLDDFQNLLKNGADLKNVQFLKYIQFFQSIGSFLIPSFILAFLFSNSSITYLKINKTPSFYTLILVIIAVVVAIPIINYFGFLNSKLELPDFLSGLEEKMIELEKEASEIMKSFLNTNSLSGYIINLLLIAVLPAICEEFIFRGVFQQLFSELVRNNHLGILITAAVFSFFHLQFYGFFPRFILGVYFGYLILWTGTLWIPIIAHFINNATAITVYYFYNLSSQNSFIDEIGISKGDLPYLISAIFLFTVINVAIFKYEKLKEKFLVR